MVVDAPYKYSPMPFIHRHHYTLSVLLLQTLVVQLLPHHHVTCYYVNWSCGIVTLSRMRTKESRCGGLYRIWNDGNCWMVPQFCGTLMMMMRTGGGGGSGPNKTVPTRPYGGSCHGGTATKHVLVVQRVVLVVVIISRIPTRVRHSSHPIPIQSN